MRQTSKWSVRQVKCPEGKGRACLLIEWKVEKGKKVLHSLSCDNPELLYYSGENCEWYCLKKISAKKK